MYTYIYTLTCLLSISSDSSPNLYCLSISSALVKVLFSLKWSLTLLNVYDLSHWVDTLIDAHHTTRRFLCAFYTVIHPYSSSPVVEGVE